MYRAVCYCSLRGDFFRPSEAEKATGIPFLDKNDIESFSNIGKYKTVPFDYGVASLDAPKEYEDSETYGGAFWLIDHLEKYIITYREYGAEDIALTIFVYYSDQCNLGFNSETLARLSSLKISLAVSAVELDE